MEDMLSKIVEMDEKARALTEEADREKAMSEQDIAKAKEAVYNQYIEKARKRIAQNEITERRAAADRLNTAMQKLRESRERLEKNYSDNCDKWVDEIVSQVINS